VDGVFVVDGVLGDWLANKYGRMEDNPLRIEIEDSRIVSLSCARQDIVDDFRAYTSTDPNSNRVGELALGTNLALTDCIGQILQDEKLPTLHIAFGHPYAEHTGADWSSTTHVDVVGRHFDIDFDGVPLMRDSRFLVDADALVP
jgi:leucyl aminopeptidase (aminopeptidase T)